MTGSLPPPGWYPDPADDQQLRWWTGERWTSAARPIETPSPAPQAGSPVTPSPSDSAGSGEPAHRTTLPASAGGSVAGASHQPADPAWSAQATDSWQDAPHDEASAGGAGWTKERLIAAIAIGGLLATSLVIWLVAVVLQGGDDGTPSVAVDDPAEEEEPDDATGGDTDDTTASDAEDTADGVQMVDFDGVCIVEAPVSELEDNAPLRPWQFDECERAPVDLGSGDGRWIVVIASIDGELSESEALERAAGHGGSYGLLWSSHYPSLNPGWWVVFDGPFAAEDDAAQAAEDAQGGAYPRLLSDDEGDRYCIAEDGC